MIKKCNLLYLLIFCFFLNTDAIGQTLCSLEYPVAAPGSIIKVRSWASEADVFVWKASGGSIQRFGPGVYWRLPAQPGLYTISARSPIEQSACSLKIYVMDSLRAAGRETGRIFWLRGEQEQKGYGLYSYFLLGAPPDEDSKERVLKGIETFLRLAPSMKELEELLDRPELNANHLPLRTLPPSQVNAEWVLENYDFARARAILRLIDSSFRRGPYLLSTLKPVSGMQSLDKPLLFQNLSTVPPHLVSNWYEEFLNNAAQEYFWEGRTIEKVALNMRTVVGVLAQGLPEVKGAISEWVTWF